MSLASTRDKRSTAGNRYLTILGEAQEDTFFKTTYGGFEDEENDNDYKEEKEVEDVTDSDISIDEADEVISDNEEDKPKKRKKGLFTKNYKEPRPPGGSNQAEIKEFVKKKELSAAAIERKKRIARLERKSIRRSTAAKSAATQERVKSRIETEKKRKMKRLPKHETKLTQEQLLKEAKITEDENIKSLEKFQKMEVEKKKFRFTRKVASGPMVRFHSTSMPVIHSPPSTHTKCERTFITFQDVKHFRRAFTKPKPHPKTLYCPVTRARAKYIDPITSVPYANKQVFHIIRETYNELLEAKGDRNNPQVTQWLDYWMEVRMERAVSAALEQGNIFD